MNTIFKLVFVILFCSCIHPVVHAQISYTTSQDSIIDNKYGLEMHFESIQLKSGAPKAVLERMQNEIDKISKKKYEGSLKETYASWLDMKKEAIANDEGYGMMGWSRDLTLSGMETSNGIFVLAVSIYEFAGGAHPNGFTEYLNFDIQTGKLVAWRDIVRTGQAQALTDYAEKVFRAEYELQPGESISARGHYFHELSAEDYPFGAVEEDAFRLSNTFKVSADDLVLFYDRYEIGPYVMPPVELQLPLTDCRQFLNLSR